MTCSITRRLAGVLAVLTLAFTATAGCGSSQKPPPNPGNVERRVGQFKLLLNSNLPWTQDDPASAADVAYSKATAVLSIVRGDAMTLDALGSSLDSADKVGAGFINRSKEAQVTDFQSITEFPIPGLPARPLKTFTHPGDIVTVYSATDAGDKYPTLTAVIVRDPDGGRVQPEHILLIGVTTNQPNALDSQLTLLRLLLVGLREGAK